MMTVEYKHILTGDGSPTLSMAPTWERMHAEEGAFTERQYLYQPLVEKAFRSVPEPVFLSLGLGLGYNEFIIAFESLHRGQVPELIASYETVDFLKRAFVNWLKDEPSPLAPVYNQIAGLYAEKYQRSAEEAKALLVKLLHQGRLQLLGAVEAVEPPPSHGILFDAFSPKTCPELWEPEFLNRFFDQAAAKPCFVATHACNSVLKRALKKNGFILEIQKGFGRKRESLSAHRLEK